MPKRQVDRPIEDAADEAAWEENPSCPHYHVDMCRLREKLPWHVRAVINTAPIWLTAIIGWASFITIRAIRDEERWATVIEWRERVKDLEATQRTMIENQGRILTLTEEIRRRLDLIHPKGTN